MLEHTLFNCQSTTSKFEICFNEMRNEISLKTNDYILNVDVNEWKQYFIEKYNFIPLTVFPNEVIVNHLATEKTKSKNFGIEYETEVYRFELKIPFTGSASLFMLRPTISKITHKKVDTQKNPGSESGFVIFTFTLHQLNEEQFKYEKQSLIDLVVQNIPYINEDLEKFKLDVINLFDLTYNLRKEKILSENLFFESLDINVERNTDKIFEVPFIQKSEILSPVVNDQTTKKYVKNPTLNNKIYDNILNVINIFFKSVEKKPSIYKSKDEEGLRDYILPTLETRYSLIDSTVTGETFNKGGKTDILIKYKDGTNLFIAECKIWKGEAVLYETIGQLFNRYLTWRDSKVAIIFFVSNKDFSKTLITIQEAAKNHSYFLKENGIRDESSFSYIFHFPEDKEKKIFLEIMAFHFPN